MASLTLKDCERFGLPGRLANIILEKNQQVQQKQPQRNQQNYSNPNTNNMMKMDVEFSVSEALGSLKKKMDPKKFN